MRSRILMVVLLLAGLVMLPAAAPFADSQDMNADDAAHQAAMNVIKDSAAALKASNPALADGLSSLASEEDKEYLLGEDTESDEDYQADIKLLKDSASALAASNPTLADGLNAYAANEEKARAHQEKNTIE
ncbi:MAG: hypothetical protein PHS37_07380 [Candidatus Omnitrophica bacterium]|nr:hypothetical protein [Candidatus Omnitrophota bacterium]